MMGLLLLACSSQDDASRDEVAALLAGARDGAAAAGGYTWEVRLDGPSEIINCDAFFAGFEGWTSKVDISDGIESLTLPTDIGVVTVYFDEAGIVVPAQFVPPSWGVQSGFVRIDDPLGVDAGDALARMWGGIPRASADEDGRFPPTKILDRIVELSDEFNDEGTLQQDGNLVRVLDAELPSSAFSDGRSGEALPEGPADQPLGQFGIRIEEATGLPLQLRVSSGHPDVTMLIELSDFGGRLDWPPVAEVRDFKDLDVADPYDGVVSQQQPDDAPPATCGDQ